MTNNELNPNEPAEIFNWIKNAVINNPPKNSPDIQLNISPSKKIDEFLAGSSWNEWDWVLLIVALEIKFNIFIPDSYVSNTNITFSEFVTGLSQLAIVKDPGYVYDRIKMLGDIIWVGYEKKGESGKAVIMKS